MIEYNYKFYKCSCEEYLCVINMSLESCNFTVDFNFFNKESLDRFQKFVEELEKSKGVKYTLLTLERICGGKSYMSVINRHLYFCSEPYMVNVVLSESDFDNLVDILKKIKGEFEKVNF